MDPPSPYHRVDGGEPRLRTASQASHRSPRSTPLEPLRILGQTLVWLGSLLLLFAVFQLWGTGLLEWHAQRGLDAEFDQLLAEVRTQAGADTPTGETSAIDASLVDGTDEPDALATPPSPMTPSPMTPAPSATAPPPIGSDLAGAAPDADLQPGEGDPIARIDIPAIGIEKTIVQGVQRQTLRAGPGHYPSTPMPGQPGNTAIAGHRTTHGAPFLDIDRLQPGDHIEVETADGLYRYEVEGHEAGDGTVKGHFIVGPSDVGVIGDQGDDRLTLTACHPRYSARERIIVTAVLVGEPPPDPVVVAEPPAPPVEEAAGELGASLPGDSPESRLDPIDPGDIDQFQTVDPDPISLEESLGWRMEELDPAVLWATITVLVIHAGWVLGLLWRRRWAYAVTTPLAGVPLFVCFIHLDRLLPAF